MKTQKIAMNIVNQLYDLADVSVDKRQAINDQADKFVSEMLVQFLQSIVSTKEKPKEGKYTDVECAEIMQSRGYTKHHTAGTTTGWSKLVGEIDDLDSMWIFADVNHINSTIELSCDPFKGLIHLRSPDLALDHPRFHYFEDKLISYMNACRSVQHDRC